MRTEERCSRCGQVVTEVLHKSAEERTVLLLSLAKVRIDGTIVVDDAAAQRTCDESGVIGEAEGSGRRKVNSKLGDRRKTGERRVGYESGERKGGYESEERRGGYESEERRGGYEAGERKGGYESEERRGGREVAPPIKPTPYNKFSNLICSKCLCVVRPLLFPTVSQPERLTIGLEDMGLIRRLLGLLDQLGQPTGHIELEREGEYIVVRHYPPDGGVIEYTAARSGALVLVPRVRQPGRGLRRES